MRRHLLFLTPTLLVAACTTTSNGPAASSRADAERAAEAMVAASAAHPVAAATLLTATGSPAGSATLVGEGGGLRLIVAAENLPAGVHGIHLHTTGKCDAPGFTTAGGHLNPGARMHGKDNPMGSHLGDLPNLTVRADGTASLSARLEGTEAQLLASLFDADGTAVIVHADADDYRTDPSGNSGARIACGVLSQVAAGGAAS